MNKMYLLLIFVLILWAVFSPLGKYVMLFMSPESYLFAYMTISYIPIVCYLALSGNFTLISRMRVKDLLQLMVWGIFFYFIAHIMYLFALSMIPASIFGMLYNLSPLITVVLSYFFLKERLTRSGIFGFGLAVFGASFIVLTDSVLGADLNPLGVLLTLISLFMFAVALIVIKKMTLKYNTYQVIFPMYSGGVLAVVLFSLIQRRLMDFSSLPTHVIWLIFILGLSAGVLEFLYIYCISKVEVSKVAYFKYLSPIFIVILSFFILQEVITYKFVIGAVFIFIGLKFVLEKA